MKKISVMLVAVGAVMCGWADGVSVADGYALEASSDGTITVATPTFQVDGTYPADAPQPYFWFDASDTNGWEWTTYGGNAHCIHTLPSKTGSKLAGVRWLSTDANVASTYTSNDGDEWYGWWGTDKKEQKSPDNLIYMRPPVYVASEATLGKPCIDFLGWGSRRALRFNNYIDEGCSVASNALRGIGTILAVYGSQNGGGWFLGGGGDGNNIRWHRSSGGDQNAEADWMTPVLREMSNAWAFGGRLRHDGQATFPDTVGFNHDWEVIGWQFTEAKGMTFGPGIGDGRGYGYQRSGGQKIAEMIFFDAVLTEAQIEKVEAYLQKKWLNRTFPGRNKSARLAYLASGVTSKNYTGSSAGFVAMGVTTELQVNAGEALTIDRVEGGRGTDSRIKKTGTGTLTLGKAHSYAGTVELAEGTLDYPALRAIPTASELPRDCFAHFDPSDTTGSVSNYVEGGVTYLHALKNLAAGRKYTSAAWYDIYLGAYLSRRCPMMLNALGAGLNVIDLGSLLQEANSATYLAFSAGPLSAAHDITKETTLNGITTYIAVYSTRGCGGHFANSAVFERYNNSYDNYYGWCLSGMMSTTLVGTQNLAGTNGVVYIDGERVDPVNGRMKNAGFQIVAVQTPGATISRLGVRNTRQYMGGQMLGETFFYRRMLSEQEIKDVSAYLAKKWLGQVNVGYTAGGVRDRVAADVNAVAASGDVRVAVAAGRTTRFGSLTGARDTTIEKAGAGTLEAEAAQVTGALAVKAGHVKVTGPLATATTAEIAANPLAWFDPTDRTRMRVENDGTHERLAQWYDKNLTRTLAAHSSGRRATIKKDALSGNDYLDFGTYYEGTSTFMPLDKEINSARSVYVIWRCHDNTKLAQIFGMLKYGTTYETVDTSGGVLDALRGENAINGEYVLFRDSYSPFAFRSAIYTNGVATTRQAIPTTNAFELIEVHMSVPAHIAALATDRGTREGGGDFGDVIIYDRVLTARERVATRNYLMAKWFNAEPQELPANEEVTNVLATLDVAADASVTLAAKSALGDLAGAGDVALQDDATVDDLTAFSGVAQVAAGKTVALTKASAPVAPKLATDGLIAQFDASDETTVTMAEGSTTGVAEWRSKVGTWKAVTGKKYITNKTTYNPVYQTVAEGRDGKRTIKLQSNSIMLFEQGGITNDIPGIKSAFWVLGTPGMGGGFLLGGGKRDTSKSREYAWHRGGADAGAYEGSVTQPLTCGSAAASVRDADWYLNGALIDGFTVGLQTNGWHCINCNFKATASAVTASGFAFDGRILEGLWNDFVHRSGHQVLAEVLLYDRVLGDDERKAVETYLAAKWGFVQAGATNDATIALAAGATLDLGGFDQRIGHLTGAGSVRNGTLALTTLVADAAVVDCVTVKGTVNIVAGQEVALAHLGAKPSAQDIVILKADAIVGLSENAKRVVFTGLPDGYRAKLKANAKGELYVALRKKSGFLLIVE